MGSNKKKPAASQSLSEPGKPPVDQPLEGEAFSNQMTGQTTMQYMEPESADDSAGKSESFAGEQRCEADEFASSSTIAFDGYSSQGDMNSPGKTLPADPSGHAGENQMMEVPEEAIEAAVMAQDTLSDYDATAGRATPDTAELAEEVSFRLTDARRRRLEEIGFVWSAREGDKMTEQQITRNSYDDQWDAMFARLADYKARFGNCLVPKRYKEDPKL